MSFRPTRRFLGLPAVLWWFVPPLLIGIACLGGAPGPLPGPQEPHELLKPIVLVARDNDSFVFVPFEKQREVSPLWAVNFGAKVQSSNTWRLAWGEAKAFGFWDLAGRWAYTLTANRFDQQWKPGDPVDVSAEDMAKLKPLVIVELDRRAPGEQRGQQLAALLGHGIEQHSRLCWQNAVILAAWLSLPIALASAVAMFVPSRRAANAETASIAS